jgi:hypothetical protein
MGHDNVNRFRAACIVSCPRISIAHIYMKGAIMRVRQPCSLLIRSMSAASICVQINDLSTLQKRKECSEVTSTQQVSTRYECPFQIPWVHCPHVSLLATQSTYIPTNDPPSCKSQWDDGKSTSVFVLLAAKRTQSSCNIYICRLWLVWPSMHHPCLSDVCSKTYLNSLVTSAQGLGACS